MFDISSIFPALFPAVAPATTFEIIQYIFASIMNIGMIVIIFKFIFYIAGMGRKL